MKEIKKPAFMQEAASGKRGNAAFIEVLIACLVFMVSGIAMGVIQLPAFMLYLFQDEEYMKLLMSGDSVSMEKAMEQVLQLPDWLVIISLFSEIMMIVVVILYCRLIEKRKVTTMGFQKKAAIRQYLAGAAAAILVFSAAYGICLLSGSIHFDGLAENVMPLYIVAYLVGYMLQGMAEEVLCRGYLFVSLSRRYPLMYSAVVSSVFFALLHGMNAGLTLLALVNLFLYGMFAAFLFLKYENIWIAGAFHSLWNFVQGNLYGIQVSGNGVQNSIFASSVKEGMSFFHGGAFGMEGGIGVTIVLVAGIVFLLRSLEREGRIVEVQAWNMQAQGYPSAEEKTSFAEEGRSSAGERTSSAGEISLPVEEAGERGVSVRENMGVQPGETPWRPDQNVTFSDADMPEPEPETVFDADYFKD